MDIRELETFIMIVQTGTFQSAAEMLHYSQTTVTLRIQKLEAELGVQLFERGRQIKLSDAGAVLYEKASQLLLDFQEVQDSMRFCAEGIMGTVEVGAIEPLATIVFPSLLTKLRTEYPNIRINLTVNGAADLRKKMEQGRLNIAVTLGQESKNFSYQSDNIGCSEVLLVLPAKHPLATRETIFCKDLEGERLLMPRKYTPLYYRFENELREHGCTRFEEVHIDGAFATRTFVQAGYCISFAYDYVDIHNFPGIVARKVEDFCLKSDLVLLTTRRRGKSQAVLNVVRQAILCELKK